MGFVVAAAFYAILTMVGMAILLERVGWLARAVQIGGRCYLVYFGLNSWLKADKQAEVEEVANTSKSSLLPLAHPKLRNQCSSALIPSFAAMSGLVPGAHVFAPILQP